MPSKGTKIIAARIPDNLYNLVSATAKKRKLTISKVVAAALNTFYGRKQPPSTRTGKGGI